MFYPKLGKMLITTGYSILFFNVIFFPSTFTIYISPPKITCWLINQIVIKVPIFNKYCFLLVLGVWLSAFSLGNFLGPTIAGLLVDYMGFIATTLVFAGLYIVMVTFDGTLAFIKCYRNYGRRNQYSSL